MWKVIGRIGLFLETFARAIVFAVKDYDLQLQRTRAPRQRYMIWAMTAFLAMIGVIVILYALRLFTAGLIEQIPPIEN